jgi:hypothetical protein
MEHRIMAYRLTKLASGSYDLWLDGRIIGSVVKDESSNPPVWIAELLAVLPPRQRPVPFTELEHAFTTLDQLSTWLGLAQAEADQVRG